MVAPLMQHLFIKSVKFTHSNPSPVVIWALLHHKAFFSPSPLFLAMFLAPCCFCAVSSFSLDCVPLTLCCITFFSGVTNIELTLTRWSVCHPVSPLFPSLSLPLFVSCSGASVDSATSTELWQVGSLVPVNPPPHLSLSLSLSPLSPLSLSLSHTLSLSLTHTLAPHLSLSSFFHFCVWTRRANMDSLGLFIFLMLVCSQWTAAPAAGKVFINIIISIMLGLILVW